MDIKKLLADADAAKHSNPATHLTEAARAAEEMRKLDEGLGGAARRAVADAARISQLVGSFRDPMADYAEMNRKSMEAVHRSMAEANEAPTARRAVSRIMEEIQAFEAGLDSASEVGVRLVSFGGSVVVHIREIGFWQPNLILFAGQLEDGSPVKLIQHLSQLSFLLMRVARLAPDEPRRAIGFTLGAAEAEE